MGVFEDMTDVLRSILKSQEEMKHDIQELKGQINGEEIWTRKDLEYYLGGSAQMAKAIINQPDFPKWDGPAASNPLFCKRDTIEYIRKKAQDSVKECRTAPIGQVEEIAPIPKKAIKISKGAESSLYK